MSGKNNSSEFLGGSPYVQPVYLFIFYLYFIIFQHKYAG
jgi:hypothetical protein